MFLARVIGRVVATRKLDGLTGVPLLVIECVDESLAPTGKTLVAADAAQSGPGDIVMVEDGREATYALPDTFVAVEAAIVGHVESVDVGQAYRRGPAGGQTTGAAP